MRNRGLGQYALRRIALLIPIAFLITVVVFLLTSMVPVLIRPRHDLRVMRGFRPFS